MKGDINFSDFERLILKSNNQLGVSILVVLTWIASLDGGIESSEKDKLKEVHESIKPGVDFEYLFYMVKGGDTQALQLSCEIIKESVDKDKALLLVNLAFSTAIVGGDVSIAKLHAINFLSDLVGLSKENLEHIYVRYTGKNEYDLLDLSDRKNWTAYHEKTEQGKSNKYHSGSQRNKSRKEGSDSRSGKKEICLATLGLDVGASQQEIKKSYRRMVQLHHPDRFASLNDEAIAAANKHFKKIQEAYEYLVNHA